MLKTALLSKHKSTRETLIDLFAKMLTENIVDAFLVPAKNPHGPLPMPTLITDPKDMSLADPLAPVAPFNSARQAAMITRDVSAKKITLVLRPCEARAFIELIKLKQCQQENVIVISMECLGRMENDKYLGYIENDPDLSENFLSGGQLHDHICEACKTCDRFLPEAVDLSIGVMGLPDNQIGVYAHSAAGQKVIETLGMSATELPSQRQVAIDAMMMQRTKARDEMFDLVEKQIQDMATFESMVANCINCYNCRTACPVCYCKECVFLTDVFVHQPDNLLNRAGKKGPVKLPLDTTMFHMTRLVHMAHACVGCGQCSSVCPNQIPVARIFKTVSSRVQKVYDYQPGRDVTEPIPVLAYHNEDSQKNPSET